MTCAEEASACEISIEINPAIGTYTSQGCVLDIFWFLACEERLIENPGSSVPYRYCCKDELCNTEEAIQQLIADSETPSTITSPAGKDTCFYCQKIDQ